MTECHPLLTLEPALQDASQVLQGTHRSSKGSQEVGDSVTGTLEGQPHNWLSSLARGARAQVRLPQGRVTRVLQLIYISSITDVCVCAGHFLFPILGKEELCL